jgi:hypothetical protein
VPSYPTPFPIPRGSRADTNLAGLRAWTHVQKPAFPEHIEWPAVNQRFPHHPYRGEDRSRISLDSLFTHRSGHQVRICSFARSITLYLVIRKPDLWVDALYFDVASGIAATGCRNNWNRTMHLPIHCDTTVHVP